MSVESEISRADAVGTASTGTYPFTFKVFAATDLLVIVRDPDTGVETDLTLTTDYTVTGVGDDAGGSVILTGSGAWLNGSDHLLADWAIATLRNPAITQRTDLRNQGRFYAQDVEDMDDRSTHVDQMLAERQSRSLVFPRTEAGADGGIALPSVQVRAGKLLAFDEDGAPTVSEGGGGEGGLVVGVPGEISVTFDAGVYTVGLFSTLAAAFTALTDQEIGVSLADLGLAWSINKAISDQTISGAGTTPVLLADRAQTVTGPFTTDTIFGLEVVSADASETVNVSVTQHFKRKRHWGVTDDASLSSAEILSLLAGSELSTARQQTRVLAPSAQYIWFAWPTSFGGEVSSDFTVNGLSNTAWTRATVSHTNASGHTENYYTFKSDNLLTGSITVVVA